MGAQIHLRPLTPAVEADCQALFAALQQGEGRAPDTCLQFGGLSVRRHLCAVSRATGMPAIDECDAERRGFLNIAVKHGCSLRFVG